MRGASNAFFSGELNGTTIPELLKKIDYTKNELENRKQVIEDILDSDFYTEYFENYYKVNVNSGDSLSEENVVCNSLERMANYLLNSEEVKNDENKAEYVFYTDENAFNKAINREPNIEGMAVNSNKENIIHFLKKDNRNFKKEKIQSIKKSDLQRNDELGEILRDYKSYLDNVTNELKNYEDSELSRYLLSRISGSVKQDMIDTKNMILGVFGYKTNAEESTVIDYSLIDMKNPEHVRALLYFKPGHRSNEDLMYTIDEFTELLEKAKPTSLQWEIVYMLRENKGLTEIADSLKISKQRVNKNIEMLCLRITKATGQV